MNNHIAVYGFTEEQLLLLTEHMPDGYVFKKYDDAVGLIGAHCICNIICSEGLDTKSREFLDSFYLDVGENADEQVIWIDSQTKPPVLEGIYFHYNSNCSAAYSGNCVTDTNYYAFECKDNAVLCFCKKMAKNHQLV